MSNKLPETFKKYLAHFNTHSLENALSLKELLNNLRPEVQIKECGESMLSCKSSFNVFDPHAYLHEGAVYENYSPWHLREGVIEKLEVAQTILKSRNNNYTLKIFDGYRPQSVQTYMREVELNRLAIRENIDLSIASASEMAFLVALVDTIWARPSTPTNPPPPHSTGGAVDLTISDQNRIPLDMGSEIDEVSARSLPNFYKDKNDSSSKTYQANRELLREVMEEAGFHRLSHEWWHFSYGDQVWAVFESFRKGELVDAIYGEIAV